MDLKGKEQNYPISVKDRLNATIFKDTSFRFLYQKTERISTAIYLITNLMNVDEPIKWKLRKTSLNLLDNVMSLSNTTLSSRDNCLREITKELFYLISLYEVASRSGFISEMNYKIVDNEMQKLAGFLDEYDQEDSKSRNNLFDPNFFNNNIEELQKGQIQKDVFTKDNFGYTNSDNIYRTGDDKRQEYQTPAVKDRYGYKGQNQGQSKRHDKGQPTNMSYKTSSSPAKSNDRSKRREKILNIIKQKKEVSVKDISTVIKDTSEKTIQRELVSMVDEGILIKEGERRWSRYSIKKS